MISRVFIPQMTYRFDHASNRRVPQYDVTPAMQFGQLHEVLTPEDDPRMLARMTPKIREVLKDFSERDYLLAIGNPSIIAICSGLILRRQKKLKMLQWDRIMRNYLELELNP